MIANWLPQDYLKATVLFELLDLSNNLIPHGTGVLVNYKNSFILATCKHIAMNIPTGKEYENLYVTVNRNDGTKWRYKMSEIHEAFHLRWYYHQDSNVDLAISPIAIDQQLDDIKLIALELFEDFESLVQGEDIFFLGYPMGIGTENISKNLPLIRGGLISLKNENKTFLIDSNVYPGSSGSPVFYRPTAADFKTMSFGTGRQPKFLGIVAKNLNYKEAAISIRSGEPRIVFEENAGLGIVYSSSLIKDILNNPSFKSMLTKATKPKAVAQGTKV